MNLSAELNTRFLELLTDYQEVVTVAVNRDMAPLIFNLDTRYKQVTSFTSTAA
jgi:hypothetical protein